MKKIIFFLLIVIVGLGGYWFSTKDTRGNSSTPSQNETPSSTPMKLSAFKISEKVIKQDDIQYPYTIQATLPQVSAQSDQEKIQKINQLIEETMNKSLDEFKKNVVELANTSTPGLPRSAFTLDYTISAFNAKVVSFELHISEYITGAAHPNNFARGFTYDLIHDRQIKTLSDLFRPDAEFLSVLSAISRTDLKEQFKTMGENMDDQIHKGTEAKPENFENFVLSVYGIRILFNPDQVAPYAVGMRKVTIATETLKELLPADSVLFLFK